MSSAQRCLTALVVAGFLAISGGSVFAAAGPRGGTPPVIDLGQIKVVGKVAKPQVFYVLGRSAVKYSGIRLNRSFVKRIVETARKNPF